jgi:hypothetical protein
MVPLAAFTTLHWTLGPPQLTRYNGFPSFTINGSAAPERSSGEAMAALERLAATLPAGIGHAWSGQSFEERLSGAQAPMLFALSVLVVFLALAALYELVDSVRGDAGRSARRDRRGARRHVARDAERHLLQGRADRDDRLVGEERDPDRRSREGSGRAAHAADRRRARPPACGCGRS